MRRGSLRKYSMAVQYFCSARQKEKGTMTKGFSPTKTPSPETVSYMKVHLYCRLLPSEGLFRLMTFCSHKAANRASPCLVHMWQKVLDNSFIWQFTDFRTCFPVCWQKEAEEPTLVQTVHFGNIGFRSIANSITHYVSVLYFFSNNNTNLTV